MLLFGKALLEGGSNHNGGSRCLSLPKGGNKVRL